MEQHAEVTLTGPTTTAQPTGASTRESQVPTLPERPLLVQIKPGTSAGPAGPVDMGGGTPPPGAAHGAWPWNHPDPGGPPRIAGMIYDHTEYEDGTLRVTLMDVHVPPAAGASATASDTFSSAAGGSAQFELPAGILSGGATGSISVSRSSTHTVSTCTRVTITQRVQYARHYYRRNSQEPDMIVTLLSHVYDTGAAISTEPITTCTCRTKRAPGVQMTKSIEVAPGDVATINVTHTNNLNLTVSAGFNVSLPVAGNTSFGLTATGDLSRTTSIDVTLPGGYTYEQYDIGGVTY